MSLGKFSTTIGTGGIIEASAPKDETVKSSLTDQRILLGSKRDAPNYMERLLARKKEVNSGNWDFNWRAAFKEDIQTGKGEVGDPLDRFMTVRDGVDAGILDEPESDNILSAPGSSPTDYTIPSPPSGLTLSSGTTELILGSDGSIVSRIRLDWVASNDILVEGYDIEAKLSSSSDWLPFAGTTSRTETTAYVTPVIDGEIYDARVRSYNAGMKKSAWVTVIAHVVAGKTAPPPDMTGFIAAQNGAVAVFRWDQVMPSVAPDYQGAEIRYGKRGIAVWETATSLTKITRGTNITSADLPPGDWTCFIKAVDSSDNYSLNAATDDLDFINTYDIITQAEQAPAWPGTLTNFLVRWNGVLVPESTRAANAHTNTELFEQFVPYPFATCEYEAPEIDIGQDSNVRMWGNIIASPGRGVIPVLHDIHLYVDTRTSVGSYTGFTEWTIGQKIGRFFKYKMVSHTAHGKAFVNSFKPVIDSQERSEEGANLPVAAGGTTVTFGAPFNRLPFISTPAFIVGGALRTAVADAVTVAGFTARIYDSSGTAVAGVLPIWRATGV